MRILMLSKSKLIHFQKLFTELKNLDSLLRYNPSRLAPIRLFSRKRQEISAENKCYRILKSFYFGPSSLFTLRPRLVLPTKLS